MKTLALARRNGKEILRDPLSFIFSVALPIVLLWLMDLINTSVSGSVGGGIEIFRLEQLAPSMAMFSLTFISLFGGMLIASDRCGSFIMRIFASPLKAHNYIAAYILPMIPLAVLQIALCFIAALLLGLDFTFNIFGCMAALLPSVLLFIGFGLLLGSCLSDKAVGGAASGLVQIAALSSGMWFDLEMIGGTLEKVCRLLPFSHAADMAKLALAGDYAATLPHLWWVLGYAAAVIFASVLLFNRKIIN